jgi:coenzyme F420-reducing hydrogenase alpha subunit
LLPALARSSGFARAPDLEGEPRETGAIDNASNHAAVSMAMASDGNSLATRLFARLVQLATSIASLRAGAALSRIDAWSPVGGEGLAVVRTARGLLVHHARVVGDRVSGYAIVAPTEWNFHPRGAVARGLRALPAANDERLAQDAKLLVALADPCVRCTVELADA